MRKVLVPLDGTPEAEAIIPDARRLAGFGGELILVREARVPLRERDLFVDTTQVAIEEAEWYLQYEAEEMKESDVKVSTHSLVLADAASAIDEAARIFEADLVAIATHGRRPLGRLVHGAVAWRALAHSPVPVMLRHIEPEAPVSRREPAERCIMVPLDGSDYAEKAIPVARELALEWNAKLLLVDVVPDVPPVHIGFGSVAPVGVVDEAAMERTQAYLKGLADKLDCTVQVEAGFGPVINTLVEYSKRFGVTDIVMASHGRTGLARVILGSVADELIHRLHLPIIVVPALASGRLEEKLAETVAVGAGS